MMSQVEILGISLPWRDIFASEGPGLKLWERVVNIKNDANSFQTDSNPDIAASTNDVLPPGNCDTSTNTQIDLLSVEDITSRSDSQPMTEISLNDPFLNPCDGRNEEKKSQRISVQDKVSTPTSAEKFISCFDTLTASCWVCEYFNSYYFNSYYFNVHTPSR